LVLLGSLNVNSIVAYYNYEAYKNGTLDSIDVDAIYDLGDEGIPYLVKLADDDDAMVSRIAENRLEFAVKYDYYDFYYENGSYVLGEKYYDDIGEYSIARASAYEALEEYIEDNPELKRFATYEY